MNENHRSAFFYPLPWRLASLMPLGGALMALILAIVDALQIVSGRGLLAENIFTLACWLGLFALSWALWRRWVHTWSMLAFDNGILTESTPSGRQSIIEDGRPVIVKSDFMRQTTSPPSGWTTLVQESEIVVLNLDAVGFDKLPSWITSAISESFTAR